MSTSLTNTDFLTFEILFFNAGLRSLTFYPECQKPIIRPDWLPKIEVIGLDNDLILKGSDRVVDFACHAVSGTSLGIDRYYWLGVYINGQDTVGDRSNFLGIGFWIPPDYIFKHQRILESLFDALIRIQEKHHLLISSDSQFLNDLEKFRASAESLKFESRLYRDLPVVGAGELERAYVKVTPEGNSQANDIAGAICKLLLKKSAQTAPRTLFLIGPDLPKLPRHGWKLYASNIEFLEDLKEYVTDFLLLKIINGQKELSSENDKLISENDALKESERRLSKENSNLSDEANHSKEQVAQLKEQNEKFKSDSSRSNFERNQIFATQEPPDRVVARASSSDNEFKKLSKKLEELQTKNISDQAKNNSGISNLQETVSEEFQKLSSQTSTLWKLLIATIIIGLVIPAFGTLLIYLSIEHRDTERPAKVGNYSTQPKNPYR